MRRPCAGCKPRATSRRSRPDGAVRSGSHAFPSGAEAIFLVVGLYLAEVFFVALFQDLDLGVATDARDALAVLLANGVVLTMAMRLAQLRYGELFHASRSSLAATSVLLLPPVIALVPGLVALVSLLMEAVTAIAPMSAREEAMFERFTSGSLAMMVMLCVLAPVLEEMLFRGIVLRAFLQRYPRWPAIALSAMLFGAAHLNLYQFVSASLGGLVLGWLYERTRSLVPCIGLHAVYNGALTWQAVRAGGRGDAPPLVDPFIAVPLGAVALFLLWRLLAPRAALTPTLSRGERE